MKDYTRPSSLVLLLLSIFSLSPFSSIPSDEANGSTCSVLVCAEMLLPLKIFPGAASSITVKGNSENSQKYKFRIIFKNIHHYCNCFDFWDLSDFWNFIMNKNRKKDHHNHSREQKWCINSLYNAYKEDWKCRDLVSIFKYGISHLEHKQTSNSSSVYKEHKTSGGMQLCKFFFPQLKYFICIKNCNSLQFFLLKSLRY